MGTKKNLIETYFEWYLNDLMENGFVLSYKREPFAFKLADVQYEKRYDMKKNPPVIENKRLLFDLTYTFDYLVEWAPKAHEYFFNVLGQPVRLWCPFRAFKDLSGNYFSFVDVKTTSLGAQYGNNQAAATFPIIQKILYSTYNIYVCKAIPIPTVQKGEVKSGNAQALFTTTFVPKRYFLTDGGETGRQIRYRTQTCLNYVATRANEIAKADAAFAKQMTLL